MKILIADDEEKIRTLIKEYAIHEGYSVLEAKDGEEVISMVTKNKIDLIILDIMMPKLDGISAYKEIGMSFIYDYDDIENVNPTIFVDDMELLVNKEFINNNLDNKLSFDKMNIKFVVKNKEEEK